MQAAHCRNSFCFAYSHSTEQARLHFLTFFPIQFVRVKSFFARFYYLFGEAFSKALNTVHRHYVKKRGDYTTLITILLLA